jgi:hypothetical protein
MLYAKLLCLLAQSTELANFACEECITFVIHTMAPFSPGFACFHSLRRASMSRVRSTYLLVQFVDHRRHQLLPRVYRQCKSRVVVLSSQQPKDSSYTWPVLAHCF